MKQYVAFLRGINVGGNTKLPMKQLAALCERLRWNDVRTYINSGNVLFRASESESKLAADLERTLNSETGKAIRVMIRSANDLHRIVAGNPFPAAKPSLVGVLLLTEKVADSIAAEFHTPGKEEVLAAKREIYIHYPDGMGRSKLKAPASVGDGTMRNINTLTKLAELTK